MRVNRILCAALALALAGCGSGGGGGGGDGGGAQNSAALSALVPSQGALSPVFEPDVLEYSVGPGILLSSVSLTATTEAPGATMTVDGTSTSSGTASAPISLALGLNVVLVVVTAPDGVTTRTYTVTFDRTSADLASLSASAGPLQPTFLSSRTHYVVEPTGSSSTLTAVSVDSTATIVIDGTVVPSGQASDPFPFPSVQTSVDVVVFPRAGTSKTYTVVFDREPDALFFDDFSDSTLGVDWTGTGTLDADEGSPAPSLALTVGQSVEYVGDSFSSDSGLTFAVLVQRDAAAVTRLHVFDAADPENRWLWMALSGSNLHAQYGEDGDPVMTFQGPIAANNELFHQIEIRIDDAGTATFRLDGTVYSTVMAFPVTDLRFSLSHTTSPASATDFGRFDEVTVTTP